MTTHTSESLKAFTERVRLAFLDKHIRAPVHLCGGNEDQVIAAFDSVKPEDWVFSTWRSNYHALLKGIPESWVFDEVLAGRSMYLMNKEHRFFSSSIVGGILPVAAGVALAIDREMKKQYAQTDHWKMLANQKVHVFVGDMTARCGIFHEFLAYCDGFGLPVRVVIEDNGLSTNTPTAVVWGGEVEYQSNKIKIERYTYQRTYPHVGIGQHVAF